MVYRGLKKEGSFRSFLLAVEFGCELIHLIEPWHQGKKSVNMVDWKYSSFFVRLDHRAHLLATKFLESGPALLSSRTIRRRDLFYISCTIQSPLQSRKA